MTTEAKDKKTKGFKSSFKDYDKTDEKALLKAIIRQDSIFKAEENKEGSKEANKGDKEKDKEKGLEISLQLEEEDELKKAKPKKTVIDLLKKRQRWILSSIKRKDIAKAPIQVKGVLFGILTEKLQLLKGDPTQRIETIPKMVFDDSDAVKEAKAILKAK